MGDSNYFKRTRIRIVGTAQILPPLPKKYTSPLKGGWCFFSLARGPGFSPEWKQVQAEAARCVASVNRRRDQLSRNAAKAILPPLPGNRKTGLVPVFLCLPSTRSMSALPPKAVVRVLSG